MIDIENSYINYKKELDSNSKLDAGLQLMLSCQGIMQFATLQCIANTNENGIKLDTLCKFGFDKEVVCIILEEFIKNKLITYDKTQQIFITTDLGKNILLALNFKSIENLNL